MAPGSVGDGPTARVGAERAAPLVLFGALLGSVALGTIGASPVAASLVDEAGAGRSTPAEDYEAALGLIEAARYGEALESLRRLQRDHPAFERMPAVQTRLAVLHEARDAGPALALFLAALAHRDEGRVEAAIAGLESLLDEHPDSSLVDDALYLVAYFALMDRYAFAEARATLLELGRRFPDTAYRDSAVYLDAIALEQLGDTDGARTALAVLRERHTALALPFDYRWPAGGLMSRYWFDRADRRLDLLERRVREASTLLARDAGADGRLRLDVSVGGIDMTLSLAPSPLVLGTAWLDAALDDRVPPPIGVYEGRVEGAADSWVRAVIRGETITGLVEIDGVRHRLLPASLVGTLDYYRPSPAREPAGDGSTLAEMLRDVDALDAPPALGGARPGAAVAGEARSDVRAVPLSIVVDSQYDRYHGGEGLAAALNDLNVADGIYRGFGFALSLDEVLTFDEARDPMALGPVSLETLLRGFRAYRLAQRTLFEGSALTYLFSGNPKTDVTLGLAWIDTLCRTDGYDVGVTTPSAFGDVLLTHELGHSLGAQHDSDTECRGEPDYLMWPNISARTPTALSPCSATSVRRSHERSCLLDAVDLSLSVRDESDVVRFVASNSDSALAVDAALLVETLAARDPASWPAGCTPVAPTSARCAIEALAPGERREIAIPRAPSEAGERDGVSGELRAQGIAELAPEDNVASSGVPLVASVAEPAAEDPSARVASGAGAERASGPSLGGAGGGGALAPLCGALLGTLLAFSAGRRRSAGARRA